MTKKVLVTFDDELLTWIDAVAEERFMGNRSVTLHFLLKHIERDTKKVKKEVRNFVERYGTTRDD